MSQLVPALNFGFVDDFNQPTNSSCRGRNCDNKSCWWQQDTNLIESDFFEQIQSISESDTPITNVKMLLALEGLNSGVPTRTTPTLTPTTLRNIEQTFIELQTKPEPHENEAGFVPPLVHSIGNNQYISVSDAELYATKATPPPQTNTAFTSALLQQQHPDNNHHSYQWHNSSNSSSVSSVSSGSPDSSKMMNNNYFNPTDHAHHQQQHMYNIVAANHINQSMGMSGGGVGDPSSLSHHHLIQQQQNHTRPRSMGGRKPVRDLNVSPEEEERRRVRRERNKAAAARCRKRRVDHTNTLVLETEELELRRQSLRNDIAELKVIKDDLEYMLDSHRSMGNCRVSSQSPPDIKPNICFINNNNNTTSNNNNNNTINNCEADAPTPLLKGASGGAIMLNAATTVPNCRPSRPKSLNVSATTPHHHTQTSEAAAATLLKLGGLGARGAYGPAHELDIAISTPSTGMHFNFDSLMVGGTGLTPIVGGAPLVPTCTTTAPSASMVGGVSPQSKCTYTNQSNTPPPPSHLIGCHGVGGVGSGGGGNTIMDMSSPDNCNPPKLVSL